MKVAQGSTLYNSVRNDYTFNVKPRLLAEFNINRYFPATVTNNPSEDTNGYDVDKFPIESLVEPHRPARGIVKAFVGQARTSPSYNVQPAPGRSYAQGRDSAYKYWRSPNKSTGGTVTGIQPTVLYTGDPKANKVVVTFESTYVKPSAFTIELRIAGNWTTVFTGTASNVDLEGRVTIYNQGGGTWSTTENRNNVIAIQGVRLNVTATDTAGYIDIIEISPRLEVDVTVDLISVNDDSSMSEPDYISPIGEISTNTGQLTLANENRLYSIENATSNYYNMLDRGVKFTMFYDYIIGAGTQTVKAFTLYSDKWSEREEDGTTSVTLVDEGRYLQEITAPPMLFENISVQEAIWRVCDVIGYNNYDVLVSPDEEHTIIPIFWTTGEDEVWNVFQDLAAGTQTAVYFDANGKLKIASRGAAFADKSPVWTARQEQSGNELPDIISINSESEYSANKVNVEVQPTMFKEQKQGRDVFEIVWEPEGTLAVRAANLTQEINSSSTYIQMAGQDAKTWPFEGIVNIEGEFIKYKGKRFKYYDGDTLSFADVETLEEQNKLAAKGSTAQRQREAALTGGLKIQERGYWNSEPTTHYATPSTLWSSTYISNYSTGISPAAGWSHDAKDGVVIGNGTGNSLNDYSYYYSGSTSTGVGYHWVGTRMRIMDGAHSHKRAGMFFNQNSNGAGYFIDVVPSVTLNGEGRADRNEIVFYSMKSDGSKKVFGGERVTYNKPEADSDNSENKKVNDIGAEAGVYLDIWFELDVTIENVGNDHKISIDYNGEQIMTVTVPNGSGWKHEKTTRAGLFIRGKGKAEFDYFYGIRNNAYTKNEVSRFLDRTQDSWYRKQINRDWMFQNRKNKKTTKNAIKRAGMFFDEFGPIIHEVREFNIKYDSQGGKPCLQSKLFFTEESDALYTDFSANAFGAYFIIANTTNRTVIVNGEDAFGPGDPVNNRTFIFARPIVQKESQTITEVNEAGITKRGEIELTFSSQWLQTEEAAKSLATWVTTQWGQSSEQLEMEVVGNPLFEIGDVIAVEHEEKTASTHKYFVVAINSSFRDGLTTKLTLRRKKV